MSENLSTPDPAPLPETLRAIYETLQGSPVLLPIPRGEKGPTFTGWQKITYAQSRDPAFTVREFRSAMPLEAHVTEEKKIRQPPRAYPEILSERSAKGNLGVLLGAPSVLEAEGKTHHLCCIDIDDPEAVEPFLAANPALAFSLRIAGARGCKIFVWIEGIYQERKVPLLYLGADGKPPTGKAKADAKQWGDWLATGGQAVVFGLHPTGVHYTAAVKKPPARIKFEDINWPDTVHLPWKKKPDGSSAAGEATEEQKTNAELAELTALHGEPWTLSGKGKITLNQTFFAAFFAKKHQLIYSPEEGRFFRYQGDASGLWAEQTEESVGWELAGDMKKISDESCTKQLINARTTSFEGAVIAKLKGAIERWKAFERQKCAKNNRPRALIHLKNGMLDLDEDPPLLRPFAADYMSRAQLDVAQDEEADCPRFKKELLDAAVPDRDDQLLLQKFAGQFLLGVNLAQMFPILTGTAGGGKSTFVNLIIGIIGEANVGELRTEHLHERFEMFEALNKTLLVGVDVPGNFLMSEGAFKIKGMVGGDLLTVEPKNGNHRFKIRGEVNLIITCNSRLKVKGDNDWDAWRRRLALINFEAPPPPSPDPSFVQKLLASEASGILNWQIEGAVLLLDDLAKYGRLQRTTKQKSRVDSLLAESDSVRDFARHGLRKHPANKVTSEQISAAYIAYCERRGWHPMPTAIVERQLPDAVLEIHGATKANDIKTHPEDKAKRGYRGLEILAEKVEDEPSSLNV